MAVRLTSQIHEFREATRHLWNSYMRSAGTWDTADEFAKVSAILFSECTLRRVGVAARPIPIDYGAEVLTECWHPDLNGRDALIDCAEVDIELRENN